MLGINNTKQGTGARPPSRRCGVAVPHGGDAPRDGALRRGAQSLGGQACLEDSRSITFIITFSEFLSWMS